MDEFLEKEPSEKMIDLLLRDYERELELRKLSEIELGPISKKLSFALSMWLEDRSEDIVDIRKIRKDYVYALSNWDERLREWISIRGSFERLENISFYMSDLQWEKFNKLQSEELMQTFSINEFDSDQLFIKQHLLEFEEFSE
ncbi:MAG: hypothetical protein CL792_01280 [Chloroflexi bacterium]|nr:hypothetical protein [Chloroflexota bacterium]|tara:strand:- start:16094 stop:16522 length:429 start_codon:yes stop_codon:yes gene_type:complete